MLSSMTGFGKATVENDDLFITVSIKTVNSRFRETKINLPPFLYDCEEKVLEVINTHTKRGKINVYIDVEINNKSNFFDFTLDSELIEMYLNELKSLTEKYDFQQNINVTEILTLPDILKYKPKDKKVSAVCSEVVKCTEAAIKNLIGFRLKEGEHLYEDIITRVKNVEKYLDIVENNQEEDRKKIFENVSNQINKLINNRNFPDDKILQEVTLLAQKADYTEEIVKLRSLIDQFKNTINMDPPVGSKIGYILQELLREVNTIASKAVVASTGKNVILMKEEFERIREQARNIE
ncbi:YicC family protein [bacterium]|nr:YicC family protein [bacterium]